MSKKLTEKFTERAKTALGLAAKEVSMAEGRIVDTEHILLGIISDESCVGYKVLSSFQVSTERIKESILASSDVPKSADAQEGFSEAAQEAIAAAALQAYLWGHSFVGTEHLLCGLAKTPSGLACHVLRSWGITYESLKARVENYTSVPQAQTAPKERPTPLLNTYGRDLTSLASLGKLDPVIGRGAEISRLLQVLGRRTKNNPVLLGEAGVGKTAVVEGLAEQIVEKSVPQKFFNTRIISLDVNALVAGTRFRGDFEERLLGILEEINTAGNATLFIDEIQTIVGAGSASGALDAANILKPALARGELRCIGATTPEEYAEFIEEDAALERRFQPVYVEEPSIKSTVSILEGLKVRYEAHHGVSFKKGAIGQAAKLASRYLPDRHLPDSAIDVLDEAASKKAVFLGQLPPKAIQISDRLEDLRQEKDRLVKEEKWPQALSLQEAEKKYEEQLTEIIAARKTDQATAVDEQDIAAVVSEMTGIPTKEITAEETEKLLKLEHALGNAVVGQAEVLKQVAATLRRNRVGLRDPNRPVGSFIFLGTSGVGKTLVAETLSEILFETPESLIRLDMSEFSEPHTVSRLLGSPPGYVGYEEGGELTERLRHRPYSVVLLDEIEKAHSEVFDTLLQVLDSGQLMDGKGRLVNFRNSVIIMTSNVGSHLIRKEGDIGFISGTESRKGAEAAYHHLSQKLTDELRRVFKVEFLNRVDSVVVFRPLTKPVVKKITRLLVKELAERLKTEQNIKLNVEGKAYDFLVEKGFSEEFGAREMRRVITEHLADPLSEGILSNRFKKGQIVTAKLEKEQIVLK
jgi:ATP-dependent Clp protease ATP-binding subunit ClpC